MKNEEKGFSAYQIFSLCAISTSLGTLCLAPFYSDAGADAAWPAAVLLAAVLCALAAAVYITCLRPLSPIGFGQLLSHCLTGPLARVLLVLCGLFFLTQAALSAFAAADAAGMYLLEHTPRGAILLALLLTSCFVCSSGLRYTCRCCEILIMCILLPLCALLAVCLFNIDPGEAAPLMDFSLSDLLRQLPSAVVSLSGAAAVVFCASHRVKGGGSAALGFGASAVVSVLLYLCAAGLFTAEGAAAQKFPFIEMTRSVSLGSIALTERFDTIFISIMLIAAVLQIALLCSCACRCFSDGLSLHRRWLAWLLGLPILALGFFLDSSAVCRIVMQVVLRGTLVIFAALVPVICIAALLKQKGGKSDA